jgi:stearoyl-CoA desaturase (delta-9 desaturase)
VSLILQELSQVLPKWLLEWVSSGVLDWSGWGIFWYLIIMTHITIASVTIYLHRHQAHRALDLHPAVSHFFRFWLWLTTGMVTKEWAAIHRKHHAKCETVDDPHSPQVLGIHTVMWRGADLYKLEVNNQETMDKFGHGTPDDWVEHHIYSYYRWQGVGLMMVINLLLFGAIGGFIWAIQMIWIPITAAGIINGIGHFWGYRNYDCEDASRNILPLGLIIGGEELHNNHHTFATSAKLSSKWYEIDIGWLYICGLQLLKLAHVKKTIPKIRLTQTQAINEELVKTVIKHRYELMAQYSKTLKEAFRQEVKVMRDLAKEFADNHYWLCKDENKLSSLHKTRLENLMSANDRMKHLIEMRRELTQIWSRSSATGDQLLEQLHHWCVKAEKSNNQFLQLFSQKLKTLA